MCRLTGGYIVLHRRRLIVLVVVAFSCSVQADVLHVDDDNCPGPGDGSEADPYWNMTTREEASS